MIRFPLLAVVLLALPAWAQDASDDTAPAADSDTSIEQSNTDLKKVQSRIESLNEKIGSERDKQDNLREELESTEKQIADTSSRLKEISGMIAAQQRKIRGTQDDQTRAENKLAEQKKALAQQIRAAYLIGERGQIRLLLNQDNAQKMDRVTAYYQYLNRARVNYAENIRNQLDKINAIQDKASQQNSELLKLKEKQQKTLSVLETTRSARGQTIREISERISNDLDEIKQLRANERNIQTLLQKLHDTLSDIPLEVIRDAKPFPQMKGKLPWPIRGKLLASFGDAKAAGHLTWNGYWIDAPPGAPVRAVANGRVAYVGWMQRYGLIIILEHEGGYFSLYGHNDSVNFAGGESVHIGDPIAKAGATGGYDQTGVYFEIRKGTQPINPKLWLSK
jgi:septal ring factor EnvC (AmiA/AmiB activator)